MLCVSYVIEFGRVYFVVNGFVVNGVHLVGGFGVIYRRI